jgi:CRP-like cAMP-binding protein
MAGPLIAKLEQFTKLSSADKSALAHAASLKTRRLQPREDIIRDGDRPQQMHLILEGWACRYKVLEDGRKQITAFLVPGDLCDLRMFILREMDHSIAALTALKLSEIPTDVILELTDNHSRIGRALWWNSLVEEAIAREWTANVGGRNAFERVAHVLCELYLRLEAVGLANSHGAAGSFELPVTQEQLADATGMTSVHANRTVRQMRDEGLVVWKGKTVTIPNLDALKTAALFNPNYLHRDRDGRRFDANDS